jgi:DNA-binding NarL/FixJ family response regulator
MLGLLGRILAKNDKIILVGSATDGQKAVRSASTLHLDLAVFDLHMPGLDGAEATRLLKKLPNPPTIFVVSSDDSFAARTRSLALGADAFLLKSTDLAAELHTAIKNFFSVTISRRTRDHEGSIPFNPFLKQLTRPAKC